jgi:NADP-reducing hydrogenase subunit HndB
MGTCGIAAGARGILTSLMQEIKRKRIEDVIVTTSGCAGLCSCEPMITVELANKAPVKYGSLTAPKIKKIVDEHLMRGKVVGQYVLALGSERTH